MKDTRSAVSARKRRPAAALSIALLAAACAAATAARRQPGVLSAAGFTPSRPPAGIYGPDPSRPCPGGGTYDLLASELERNKEPGKLAPQPEGRLCALAEALLGWDESKESPPESVLAFLSSYFGLPAPVYRVVLSAVETEDPKDIAPRLAEPVAGFARNAVQPRYGLATLRVKKGTTRLALVMHDFVLDLDPLPRQLAPGAQTTLSGRFLEALQNPKLLTCDASGKLETKSIPAGDAFRADLRCSDKPGITRVEIRADRKGGTSALGNLPVACGTELPSAAPVPGEKAAAEVAGSERKLFEMIDGERKQGGLPQLSWDPAVAQVARAIAESEREEAKRGSAVGGPGVVERLKKGGVSSLLILQNPAEARTAEEAQLRFSRSPTHRCNYLNPEVTDAGVGVAIGPEIEGRASAFVTELFVKQLPAIDVASAREKLRAAIARKRADARAPALTADPALDRVAEQYAKLLASTNGGPPKDKADEIARPLYRAYRTVSFVSGVKGDPLEMAEEPGIVGDGKLVGVGVAQGPHPNLGKNAVYVTVLIAAPR